jgi:hypothetical protein
VLANVAVIKTMTGAPREDVLPLVMHAWGDGALLGDEGPGGHLWSLLTAALEWNDWHADAADIANAVLNEGRRRGALLAVATASYVLGGINYRRGRIADAAADLEFALDAQRDGWGAYVGAAGSLTQFKIPTTHAGRKRSSDHSRWRAELPLSWPQVAPKLPWTHTSRSASWPKSSIGSRIRSCFRGTRVRPWRRSASGNAPAS